MSVEVQPAAGGTRLRGMLRLPSFWIVVALLAAGGVRMVAFGEHLAAAYPLATLTAVALFALLAVPFWLFVSELDFLEREPTPLLVVAFAWGGLVATSVSIPGSEALDDIVAKLGSPHLAADWGAALAGPTIEEIAKTLGLVAIVLIARAHVNSVLDGIVYGAMVGLGFQIVEDIVFALGAVALAGRGDDVQPVVTTFLLRGFLAGVWSHTLFGALAGAGIGYLVVRADRPPRIRIGVAALAVIGAWACHVLWNSPLFARPRQRRGGPAGRSRPQGPPPLLLILWLVRSAHDREADYYVGRLATLRDPELITAAELDVLGSGSRRSAARWHAGLVAGRAGRAAVRRLQRAQARLAVELSRASYPSSATDAPPTWAGTATRCATNARSSGRSATRRRSPGHPPGGGRHRPWAPRSWPSQSYGRP